MKGWDLIAFRIATVFCPALLTVIWWYLCHDEIGGGFAVVFLGPLIPIIWGGCVWAFIKASAEQTDDRGGTHPTEVSTETCSVDPKTSTGRFPPPERQGP